MIATHISLVIELSVWPGMKALRDALRCQRVTAAVSFAGRPLVKLTVGNDGLIQRVTLLKYR